LHNTSEQIKGVFILILNFYCCSEILIIAYLSSAHTLKDQRCSGHCFSCRKEKILIIVTQKLERFPCRKEKIMIIGSSEIKEISLKKNKF
jgi:hypothetical protein